MAITQLERLATVETKIDLLSEKVDAFIKAADDRYASKEEVQELKQRVSDNTNTLLHLIRDWGPTVTLGGLVLMQFLKGGF